MTNDPNSVLLPLQAASQILRRLPTGAEESERHLDHLRAKLEEARAAMEACRRSLSDATLGQSTGDLGIPAASSAVAMSLDEVEGWLEDFDRLIEWCQTPAINVAWLQGGVDSLLDDVVRLIYGDDDIDLTDSFVVDGAADLASESLILCSACGEPSAALRDVGGRPLCPDCAKEIVTGRLPMGFIVKWARSQRGAVAKRDETSPSWDNVIRAMEGDGRKRDS